MTSPWGLGFSIFCPGDRPPGGPVKPISGGDLDFCCKEAQKAGRHLGRKISFVGAGGSDFKTELPCLYDFSAGDYLWGEGS